MNKTFENTGNHQKNIRTTIEKTQEIQQKDTRNK